MTCNSNFRPYTNGRSHFYKRAHLHNYWTVLAVTSGLACTSDLAALRNY